MKKIQCCDCPLHFTTRKRMLTPGGKTIPLLGCSIDNLYRCKSAECSFPFRRWWRLNITHYFYEDGQECR